MVDEAKSNLRILYRYLNDQMAIKSIIKTLRENNGKLRNKPVEIVEILNQQFYSVFVNEGADQLTGFFEFFETGCKNSNRFLIFGNVFGYKTGFKPVFVI